MSPWGDELEGRWQMIRADFEGESVPELIVTKTLLEIVGARYSITFENEIVDAGRLTIEEAPTHRRLTLQCAAGANAGRTVRAIYQRVGDRLRICFGFNGNPPEAFATTPDSKLYLATYRRIRAQ